MDLFLSEPQDTAKLLRDWIGAMDTTLPKRWSGPLSFVQATVGHQLGHRGFVAVRGGARDCPYTYVRDLAAGTCADHRRPDLRIRAAGARIPRPRADARAQLSAPPYPRGTSAAGMVSALLSP
jgi:hypothetical protein